MRLSTSPVFDSDSSTESLSPLNPTLLDERTYDARAEFEDVFNLLLETRSLPLHTDLHQTSLMDTRMAAQLQAQLQHYQSALLSLPQHAQYSRHIIGTDDDWIGYICRWEPHICSSIHGHPSFAYYQVCSGEFEMDMYKVIEGDRLEHTQHLFMGSGDCIWQQGRSGCYDNMVHKVSTKNTGGFTLHLFSENPALGQHFDTH